MLNFKNSHFHIIDFKLQTGKTGDWKNHLSPELNRRVEAWIEANLAKSDLRFVMELEQQD